ncbi:MAG: hypothetical protein M1818_004219 [Claussenomyces sp. TS43310]|nr:MAG: hypothetical protein M1818_004219 [Claussenomyces sp. TS43310]
MSAEDRTILLRNKAHAFCQTLSSPPAPTQLIDKYFTSDPKITEHGPAWANAELPFLGRTFAGKGECLRYFELLAASLTMHLGPDSFPAPHDFTVDAGAGRVSVVGRGRFESVSTGKAWSEQFVYALSDWDDEGRLGHWEIWADPLSAWVAVQGDPKGLMAS